MQYAVSSMQYAVSSMQLIEIRASAPRMQGLISIMVKKFVAGLDEAGLA